MLRKKQSPIRYFHLEIIAPTWGSPKLEKLAKIFRKFLSAEEVEQRVLSRGHSRKVSVMIDTSKTVEKIRSQVLKLCSEFTVHTTEDRPHRWIEGSGYFRLPKRFCRSCGDSDVDERWDEDFHCYNCDADFPFDKLGRISDSPTKKEVADYLKTLKRAA